MAEQASIYTARTDSDPLPPVHMPKYFAWRAERRRLREITERNRRNYLTLKPSRRVEVPEQIISLLKIDGMQSKLAKLSGVSRYTLHQWAKPSHKLAHATLVERVEKAVQRMGVRAITGPILSELAAEPYPRQAYRTGLRITALRNYEEACARLRLQPQVLRNRVRYREYVHLRWAMARYLRDRAASLKNIGQVLGLDHVTVLYGLRRVERDLQEPETAAYWRKLLDKIEGKAQTV